eukprot:TRINITY_DN3975_c0_g1_i4.p1 TRINITY_DN3975_c0_g1~~TRINITY_DN3975_c0_g1_i4.p1  ORF type:complete len:490 (+),score=75.81 TRINITY_DN3975_c0_g1_i4:73-1542(+)
MNAVSVMTLLNTLQKGEELPSHFADGTGLLVDLFQTFDYPITIEEMEILAQTIVERSPQLYPNQFYPVRNQRVTRTITHLASNWDSDKIIPVLVAHGADLHVQESESTSGWLPIHFAVKWNNLKTVKALILAGSRVRPDYGETWTKSPLEIALQMGFAEVVSVLSSSRTFYNTMLNTNRRHLPYRRRNALTSIFTILSLDGGGIRGLFGATILEEIEKRLNCHLSSLFNLVVGTSTGALIGGGLTATGPTGQPKYTASHIKNVYMKSGIFSRKQSYGLFSVTYDVCPLESLCTTLFQDQLLCESSSGLIITTYDANKKMPVVFYPDNTISLVDAVRASTAAPTYFPAHNYDDFCFIDGGVTLNNPTQVAYSYAKKLGYNDDCIWILSIGTGEPEQPTSIGKAKWKGALYWATEITEVTTNTSMIDANLKDIFYKNSENYNRIQFLMSEPIALDADSSKNKATLQHAAQRWISTNPEKFKLVVSFLKSLW